jgi:hypothetical protein
MTLARELADQQEIFLPMSGGSMTGPLFLHDDPQHTLHASTRRFVENVKRPNNIIHSQVLAQAKGSPDPSSATASYGATSYPTYDRNILTWSYTPKLSNSKIIFDFYLTFYHTGNTNSWNIHLGRVYDSAGNIPWHHSWVNSSYPSVTSTHNNMHLAWQMDSWGITSKSFDYAWARHPGVTTSIRYDYSVYVMEIAQ